MKLTKTNLKHLIMGKILEQDNPTQEEILKARQIAIELIEVMEEQDMFKDDVK